MPKDINEAHIKGRAGRDAEICETRTGKTISKFSLATGGGKRKDGSGEYSTEWHNIEAWGSTTAQSVRKGDVVEVFGRLKTDSWEAKDGQTKYRTVIVAAKIEIEGRESEPAETPKQAARQGSYPIDDEGIPF